MMTKNLFFVFALILNLGAISAADSALDLSSASGRELIQALIQPETCAHAYHELSLRADSGTSRNFDQFSDTHRNPKVIECPQPMGKEPIYVVLSDFLSHIDDEYPSRNLDQPKATSPKGPLEKQNRLMIEVFTSTGIRINPFICNNNVLEGIIADMNRDGFIERADNTSFGVQGVKHADVFQIQEIGEVVVPLLSLLYNWGNQDDWDYAFSDRDNDGFVEVDFGPITEDGFKPEVTFHWDERTRAFAPPPEGVGNHLRILDAGTDWDDLNRLQAEIKPFPADPDAASSFDRSLYREGKTPPQKENAKKAISFPYEYESLKNLSDEQIFRYMGEGKNLEDLETNSSPSTVVPQEFWKLPAKEAALTTAKANEALAHNTKYQVVLGSSDQPPERVGIALSEMWSHSALDPNIFLRVQPDDTRLIYAGVTSRRIKEDDPEYDVPQFDFRICDVDYREARKAAQRLWYLRRIHTIPPGKPNDQYGFYSTGGGWGTLQMIVPDGSVPDPVSADLSGPVSTLWTTSFGDEEFLGIASELFDSTHWPSGAESCWRNDNVRKDPNHVPDLQNVTERILKDFSIDQSRVSYKIVEQAIWAVGVLAMKDLAPDLDRIMNVLPNASEAPRRCVNEIDAEIHRLENNDPFASNLDEELALYDEEIPIKNRANRGCAFRAMRESIQKSREQLSAVNDTHALIQWIHASKPGWQWALWRLHQVDSGLYIETLGSLYRDAKPDPGSRLLKMIADVDFNRGVEVAQAVPADNRTNLGLTALTILGKAGKATDLETRIGAMIGWALDSNTDWYTRYDIIKALVPEDNPVLFSDPQIDAGLLKMLELLPKTFGSDIRSVAARALALHAGPTYFDRLLRLSMQDDTGDRSEFYAILESVAATNEQRLRLAQAFRPQFLKTGGYLNGIVWAAWTDDLKSLKGEIEQLATSSPADTESEQCTASSESQIEDSNSGVFSQSSEKRSVYGRCHEARHVAALWNEEDLFTRVKLLLSFYLQQPYFFDIQSNRLNANREQRLRAELRESAKLVSVGQQAKVIEFMEWAQKVHPFVEYDLPYQKERDEIFAFVKTYLQPQREAKE
jgi:hypothetical protein